jgi:site-specific recombinase XerD
LSRELIPLDFQPPGLPGRRVFDIPALLAASAGASSEAWEDFFTATIDNDHTRVAYARALHEFMAFAALKPGVRIHDINTRVVAAWREWLVKSPLIDQDRNGKQLISKRSIATIKLKMAAVRSFFSFLKERGVVSDDPAAGVKAPKYSQEIGKTRVLRGQDAPKVLDIINARIEASRDKNMKAGRNPDAPPSLAELRDRALIGVMTFAVARVSAAINLRIGDLFLDTQPRKLRLIEKGTKLHEVALHHELEGYLVEYLAALKAIGEPVSTEEWVFRAFDPKSKKITRNPLDRVSAWRLVDRRARGAGFNRFDGRRPRGAGVSPHSFRGTGITSFLDNGGHIERARKLANHVSIRTTQLYDHTNRAVGMDDAVLIDLRRKPKERQS